MGPQHVRDEVLQWVRGKTERTTGIELAIPIHPELRRTIDAAPNGHLNLLVTEFGKPFTAAGFGNWFREQYDIANLHHCSFHGLRKACRRHVDVDGDGCRYKADSVMVRRRPGQRRRNHLHG